MKKQEAVNTFSEGLILDLNPLLMPNNALTNCLNGTLLTYNGNENMLLNDMGNCRVETAMLPEGYIPLGSTSFGGIIYIISYNPLDKKYLIGSFPSPERNLSRDELGDTEVSLISMSRFCDGDWSDIDDLFGDPNNIITNYYLKVNLTKDLIHAGDKYKVFSDNLADYVNMDAVSAYGAAQGSDPDPDNYSKKIKFEIVSTLDDGKIVDLTSKSIWNRVGDYEPFYIQLASARDSDNNAIELDEYRKLISANYDVYSLNAPGQLGVAAKLEVPTSFSVGYEMLPVELNGYRYNSGESVEYTLCYQLYFYINWSNDVKGDYKGRINPDYLYYSAKTNSYNKWVDKQIILASEFTDRLGDGTLLASKLPDDYYSNEFDLERYLENYLENNENWTSNYRENDGTDSLYVIKGPLVLFDGDYWKLCEKTGGDSIKIIDDVGAPDEPFLHLKVLPGMTFGKLKFLEKKLIIDLSKINSGDIYMKSYQYYVDDTSVNMDFTIEAYPEPGKRLNGGRVEFYPLMYNVGSNTILKNNPFLLLEQYTELAIDTNLILHSDINDINPSYSYNLEGNISGNLLFTIDKEVFKDLVNYPNRIYIVKFILNYTGSTSNKEKIFYRLFFNSNIFNSAYNVGYDFKDLYLYEPEKKYGIKPSFNTSSNIKENKVTPNGGKEEDFRKYSETLLNSFTDYRDYVVSNKILSSFTLNTGLEGSMQVDLEEFDMVNKNSIRPKYYASDNRVIIDGPPLEIEPELNDNNLSIENKYDISIPYTIEYSNRVDLPIYTLNQLKDGGRSRKVFLSHFSQESEEGYFALYDSQGSNVSDGDRRLLFILENDKSDYTLDLDNEGFLDRLRAILENSQGDYMSVYFGVLNMLDDKCGYGYSYKDIANYYQFPEQPIGAYIIIDCVRVGDDSVVLLHSSPENNSSFIPRVHAMKGSLEFPGVRTYGATSRASGISNYKRYTDTGNKKTFYYINNIDGPIDNPTITVEYPVQLSVSKYTPKLRLVNSYYSFDTSLLEYKDKVAKNLQIMNLDNITSSILVESVVNNKEWIIEQSSFNTNSNVYTTDDKFISDAELHTVYTMAGKEVSTLEINASNKVALADTWDSGHFAPTTWYFAWENVNNSERTPSEITKISWNALTGDGKTQWYRLQKTYGGSFV